MSHDPLTALSVASLVQHGFMAVFGALVHALKANRDGATKGPIDLIVLVIMSSFSGLMFALAAGYMFHSEYITLASAGAGGYLGVEGLTWLAVKIKDFIGFSFDKNDKK